MISLHSCEASPPRSVCEYKASRDGSFAWFLLTFHPEKDNVLEEIVAEIKLEVINSKINAISRLEIEKWLKQFFRSALETIWNFTQNDTERKRYFSLLVCSMMMSFILSNWAGFLRFS